MVKIFLYTFIIFSPLFSIADTIELKGNYIGKNLYVINSTISCVDSVTVNNKTTTDEVHSNSFEIDLAVLKIKIGADITVNIFHKSGCVPMIVNPEVIKITSASNFLFTSIKAEKNAKLIWTIKGNAGVLPFKIEQFKWKKWIEVGEVLLSDSSGKSQYSFETKMLHFETNIFRIKQTDTRGVFTYSKEIKLRSIKPEVIIETRKIITEIKFSVETMYEIFDDKGNFMLDGTGLSVNINDLPKGKYWINYDNKTENFTKK